jgi:hypothetical protein
MAENDAAGDPANAAEASNGGRPAWVLWVGLGVLALVLLGICAGLVVTLDLLPNAEQPTPIPSPSPKVSRIEIAQPGQGSTVDISQPVVVSGVGTGLFEGNVVVQAYDGQSNLLAEGATVIDSPDAETGGSGPWTVTLNLTAPTDPEGLIFAFSNSPSDGSITASSSVEVAYVDSSISEPALVILNPDSGSVIDISQPFEVIGGGVGLFENNVVVRALDETGKVLVEQITITDASEPGGAGRWSVNLTVQVTAGTKGRIITFSPAVDGNTPDATDEAAVTYGIAPTATPGPTATATPTPVPSTLAIAEPPNGSVVPVGQGFPMSGTGSNLFENNVVVRAYDQNGTILAEQATNLNTDSLGGSGTWSVTLTVQVEAGIPGQITAFSPSPVEGEQPTASSIAVTYGQGPATQARIAITFPTHPSVIDANAPIDVTGTGAGIFENNVVVQVLDWEGNVLAEAVTTLDAAEAGGAGSWSVQLAVRVERPTPGIIVAFSPSATGGNPAAYDGVGVIYNIPVAVQPIAPAPTVLPTSEQPIVPPPESTTEPSATSTS